MKTVQEILEAEEKYKKLLVEKLSGNDKIALSCPEFKYPEPAFVYIKSIKTEKTIAIRLDGVDNTMRFWDYIDDDYSDENGVWDRMTEKGLATFCEKLNRVMEKAVDIEFFDADGECEDYFSGVVDMEFTPENAQKAVKKAGKNVDFVIAVFSDFFGDNRYVFDRALRRIVR